MMNRHFDIILHRLYRKTSSSYKKNIAAKIQGRAKMNSQIKKGEKIGLFTVSSTLGKQVEVGKKCRERAVKILEGLKNVLEIPNLIIDVKTAEAAVKALKDKICGGIIVVSTGGTEKLIRTISAGLNNPVLIWANPFNNSLPSCLEAYAVLKDQNLPIKIFYSAIDLSAIPKVNSFIRISKAIHRLESKLGCVGRPSPWILTGKSRKLTKEKIGPEIFYLELADLLNLLKEVDVNEAKKLAGEMENWFGEIEVATDDIVNAAKIYLAMRLLILKHDLSAITIRCFDLIKQRDVTGCIGMSLCNDQGMVAGCEADLESTLTMMIVSFLTGEPCWMANPARIDVVKNTITLAHCTVATGMITDLSKSALISHFESGKGVSIRGLLRKTRVTLARLGGKGLRRMLIATGKIVRSDMRDPNLCRTQVEVKLDGNVQDFIEKSLGNHQILAYGDLKPLLKDFCVFKGIEPITID